MLFRSSLEVLPQDKIVQLVDHLEQLQHVVLKDILDLKTTTLHEKMAPQYTDHTERPVPTTIVVLKLGQF